MAKHHKLGRSVAMVGAGLCKFGAYPQKTGRDLFWDAYQAMTRSVERGFDPAEIEAMYVGNYAADLFEGQGHLAPILADTAGLTPIPAIRVEVACASGGAALRQGVLAIASGAADVVLVVGVEKMTSLPTAQVTDALATAADMLYEVSAGLTFPGLYALIASAYMQRYGMTSEHLMNVAIKNHENGALNPNAQFGKTIPDWMAGRVEAARLKGKPVPTWGNVWDFLHDEAANPTVAYPLRLFDCSPVTDGAAVVLLTAGDLASRFTDHPVYVIGSGQASDVPLSARPELTSMGAARAAADMAYAMAGVTPRDIRLAEVHDCFTISEVIAGEDLGFFKPGEGFKMAEDGVTARNGAKPINTSGGLKSKGHPVGATGVAQACEVWQQLRGEAGERQVTGQPAVALTHNLGGTGTTCVVHIYERR